MRRAVAAALWVIAGLEVYGPAWAAVLKKADPARIAADPGAYVGEAVTVAVKFTKIDNGSEPWEEQANLKASSKIKFTAAPFAEIKCYADRTPRNMEALTGIKKGKQLILTGAIRRYRTKVHVTYHRKVKATGKWITVKREEKARIRYAFIVETIARAE
ncbi:MAG: hypothetical protein NTX71_11835 [Candidatus Aureabacteria bacterium]|nr:hypothetical protein [Candidatus Auribacterota bacterium]